MQRVKNTRGMWKKKKKTKKKREKEKKKKEGTTERRKQVLRVELLSAWFSYAFWLFPIADVYFLDWVAVRRRKTIFFFFLFLSFRFTRGRSPLARKTVSGLLKPAGISRGRFLGGRSRWIEILRPRIQPGNNEYKNRDGEILMLEVGRPPRAPLFTRILAQRLGRGLISNDARAAHISVTSEFKKSTLSICRGLTVGEVNFSRVGTFPSKRTTFASCSEIEGNKYGLPVNSDASSTIMPRRDFHRWYFSWTWNTDTAGLLESPRLAVHDLELCTK